MKGVRFMSKTNIGLVAYAKELLTRDTIYILGGISRRLTEAMIQTRINKGCRHTIANQARIRQGIGRFAYDCNAIMKCYLWEISPGRINYDVPEGSDLGSRSLYNASKEKGPLSTMPDIPGLLVWTLDLGHMGVYVGKINGINQYIEATPAWGAWGVTTSADRNHPQGHNRQWAFWGKYHLIDYIQPKPEPKPTTVKVGDRVIVNGVLHRDSAGNGAGQTVSNLEAVISRVNAGAVAPYHVGQLGWVKPEAIKAPAPVVSQPAAPQRVHTVKVGDTLSGIARRYNVSLGHILNLNPQIRNKNLILPGWKIKY